MRKSILVLGLLFSIQTYANCESSKNQADTNKCLSSELEKATAKINLTYTKYLNDLNEPAKSQFKNAQRSWIKFKDSDCDFQTESLKNGSMYSSVVSNCLLNKTNQRILEIEKFSNCEKSTTPNCL